MVEVDNLVFATPLEEPPTATLPLPVSDPAPEVLVAAVAAVVVDMALCLVNVNVADDAVEVVAATPR